MIASSVQNESRSERKRLEESLAQIESERKRLDEQRLRFQAERDELDREKQRLAARTSHESRTKSAASLLKMANLFKLKGDSDAAHRWYAKVIDKYPDLPAATIARRLAGDDEPYRIWTEASGQRTIEAAFVDFKDGIVLLKKRPAAIVRVPIEMLSDADQEFVNELERLQNEY